MAAAALAMAPVAMASDRPIIFNTVNVDNAKIVNPWLQTVNKEKGLPAGRRGFPNPFAQGTLWVAPWPEADHGVERVASLGLPGIIGLGRLHVATEEEGHPPGFVRANAPVVVRAKLGGAVLVEPGAVLSVASSGKQEDEVNFSNYRTLNK